jgi:hypothetical protein
MIRKMLLLAGLALGLGWWARAGGLSAHQALAIGIFSASILGTLFFWDFRLSFAFLGTSTLLLTKTVDLESVLRFSSLEVILFLVGMMVLVGMLKDAGFFAWVVHLIIRMRHLTGVRFLIALSVVSAVLSSATSEIVSIIFVVAAVLEICDYFEADPIHHLRGPGHQYRQCRYPAGQSHRHRYRLQGGPHIRRLHREGLSALDDLPGSDDCGGQGMVP